MKTKYRPIPEPTSVLFDELLIGDTFILGEDTNDTRSRVHIKTAHDRSISDNYGFTICSDRVVIKVYPVKVTGKGIVIFQRRD